MGKCSICQGGDHNKRTCPQKPGIINQEKVATAGVNTTPQKSTFSTSATTRMGIASTSTATTNKSEIIPIPAKPPMTSNNNLGTGGQPKKLNAPSPNPLKVPDKVIYPPQIHPTQIIEAAKAREKVLKAKDADLIKKLESIPKNPSVQTTTNFCNGCHNHGHLEEKCPSLPNPLRNDRYDKKCSHCGQSGHYHRTCPELEEERAEKAAKLSETASWLNPPAKARFCEPLTPAEGPGYIYMYTYDKPKTPEDKDLFKIGMSKNEEGKRRIAVQEARNKEHYRVIYHEETPYRYLTENVIHLHLKESRDPREVGDGRTEWFRGSQEYFLRVIKDVIKEVRFGIQNEFFDTPPPSAILAHGQPSLL